MKEQDIQQKITNWLESEGCYVVKVVNATKSGVPDVICCTPRGLFVGIEIKTLNTKNNVSKLQQYNLDAIEATGGHSFVAWSLDMVKENMEDLL